MLIVTKNLVQSIMTDCGFLQNDIKYVLRRLAGEGYTFLTITLPSLGKHLIKCLEIGHFDREHFTCFRFKNSLIGFAYEYLSKIFDSQTGRLLVTPCGQAIKYIRQVCEYLYKLSVPYDTKLEEEATTNFIKNEKELRELGTDPEVAHFSEQLRKDFETFYPDLSGVEVHKIFSSFRPRPTSGTFIGSGRDYFLYRESESNHGFLQGSNAYKGYYKPYDSLKVSDIADFFETRQVDYSELLLVPKDSRGPRTICREAIKRLETQMAYFDFMCSGLTRYSEGAINFKDQTVNRRIAEESSVSRSYATLDLKDASDRVSYAVVKTVFRNSPGLRWFITGERRATHVKVNGNRTILSKLAGMGSGLTFPTMSLLISLAICNRVQKIFNLPYEDIRKCVFVYGDDICVPRNWYATAISALGLIGLEVNTTKSFIKGFFRESCGADFFAGSDVAPIRLKLSSSKPIFTLGGIETSDSPFSFEQIYAHVKELHLSGFDRTGKYLMSVLRAFHKTVFNKDMVPGVFNNDSDLLVDFYRGTGHHCVDDTIRVLTITPSKRKYDRTILSETGSALRRSPEKYMSTSLAATKCPLGREKNLEKIRFRHLNIEPSRSFSEITVPRSLEFRFKETRMEYIVDFVPKSRQSYLNDIRGTHQMETIGRLIFAYIKFGALL